MAIIDQKGRLFGKVNLLDLTVVLVILAVAGRFGYQYVKRDAAAPAAAQQIVEVQFLLSPVRDPSVTLLQVNNAKPIQIYDSKSQAYLGQIVEVKTSPAKVHGDDSEYESKYTFDHIITVRGTGLVSENGVTLGGVEMKVGRAQDLRTSGWAGTGMTWNVNSNPPERPDLKTK
ncbi:MAG TPA: DUF4330 domain-containing protein [Symbiobacteriaceae bacterium]|nr:DUF4330 domain-containing protein [Symbiobacteriaceae bacterium]